MITITERAREGLSNILNEKRGNQIVGLRLQVTGGVPGAYQSNFRLVKQGEAQPDDIVLDEGDFKVFLDPNSAAKLKGAKIDIVPTFRGPSFKIDYPAPEWDDPLAQQVQELITNRVNPGVAVHGGNVRLVGVEDGVVYLEFGGGCQGCGLTNVTLRQGIEVMLKNEIPAIRGVVDKTDHSRGTNPFYRPSEAGLEGESPLAP